MYFHPTLWCGSSGRRSESLKKLKRKSKIIIKFLSTEMKYTKHYSTECKGRTMYTRNIGKIGTLNTSPEKFCCKFVTKLDFQNGPGDL